MSFAQSVKYEFTLNDYKKAVEEGWVSSDISYKELIELNESADEYFKRLNFKEVYSVKNFQNFDNFGVSPYSNVNQFNPGDVFIMNSSASYGLSGHSVMALSNNEFVSIYGKGKKPNIFDRSKFTDYYVGRDIKVYRSNNYYWGVGAQWADSHYNNSNAYNYSITSDLTDIYNTYCSKMVYHSYIYGASSSIIMGNFGYPSFEVIHPKSLPFYIQINKHGEYDGYSK